MKLLRNAAHGAVAGAAGMTALNGVTYLDMAVRGRPASDTRQQAVEAMANRSGHPIPGDGEDRRNRLTGLGSLGGTATGMAIGVVAGLVRPGLARLPGPVAAVGLGLAVMAVTDGSLVRLGLTDPRKWSATDWASDVVPHLAYGAMTYVTLRATDVGGRPRPAARCVSLAPVAGTYRAGAVFAAFRGTEQRGRRWPRSQDPSLASKE
jgi:hypothetical protein